MASASIYRKLGTAADEIRLLRPFAASSGTTAWELVTHRLQECPPFTSLSYLWGTDAESQNVVVDNHAVAITPNLALALQHVGGHWQTQYPGRPVEELLLWTDALRINMDDSEERGHQVKVMGRGAGGVVAGPVDGGD